MAWDRNYGNSADDFFIRHAIEEIDRTYGDRVRPKAKSLFKFGKNLAVGTSLETVWETGGTETYVTTNAIDTVSSSATEDTAVTLYLEGHTVTGTGTDAQFGFTSQLVELNGRNKVLLATPLARVSRSYVTSGTLVGDVYIAEDDTLTNGVPQTQSKIHLGVYHATNGDSQSFKAATTLSNDDYLMVTSVIFSVGKKTTATVDFSVEVRSVGSIFLPKFQASLNTTGNDSIQIDAKPYFIVPKNADIRIEALASTTNVEADAMFIGILCENTYE